MYQVDENLLNIATEELFEEIRKQKSQKEKDIEFLFWYASTNRRISEKAHYDG